MKKRCNFIYKTTALGLSAAMILSLSGCGASATADKGTKKPDSKNPVTITIWNYYNGDQLAAFETLIDEFNSTEGADKGIVAVTVSQGDIQTLANSLLDSINGKAGAQETPTLAAVYSETAFILEQSQALAPFDSYFTEDELSAYVPGFIDEGRFNANNDLLLFPVSKSTEMFTANETDWAPFAADTGITLESLNTKEDLTAAAKSYYEWTDAQTPDVPNDGKALYGRDSMGNYIYIGCFQLGHELFHVDHGELTVDLDRDTFKTLWDNYYIPYINGYFGSYAKFRSEDCKTGKILALTSSSSSVTYLPDTVTLEDDTTHDIKIYERPSLKFADATQDAVVQQGASYCMLKSDPEVMEGAVEFLKWFTSPERNLTFSVMSGYSPVTVVSNTRDAITKAYEANHDIAGKETVLDSVLNSADMFSEKTAYATKPFDGSKSVRAILDTILQDKADEDRAAVLAALEQGASLDEATAEFSTDEYFDTWFADLSAQVHDAIKK